MTRVAYKVEMRVEVTDVAGRQVRPTLAKDIAAVDSLGVAATRAWATRNFNRLIKECAPHEIVTATFWAQQTRYPHSSLSGDLSGVNGREMRRTGIFERW